MRGSDGLVPRALVMEREKEIAHLQIAVYELKLAEQLLRSESKTTAESAAREIINLEREVAELSQRQQTAGNRMGNLTLRGATVAGGGEDVNCVSLLLQLCGKPSSEAMVVARKAIELADALIDDRDSGGTWEGVLAALRIVGKACDGGPQPRLAPGDSGIVPRITNNGTPTDTPHQLLMAQAALQDAGYHCSEGAVNALSDAPFVTLVAALDLHPRMPGGNLLLNLSLFGSGDHTLNVRNGTMTGNPNAALSTCSNMAQISLTPTRTDTLEALRRIDNALKYHGIGISTSQQELAADVAASNDWDGESWVAVRERIESTFPGAIRLQDACGVWEAHKCLPMRELEAKQRESLQQHIEMGQRLTAALSTLTDIRTCPLMAGEAAMLEVLEVGEYINKITDEAREIMQSCVAPPASASPASSGRSAASSSDDSNTTFTSSLGGPSRIQAANVTPSSTSSASTRTLLTSISSQSSSSSSHTDSPVSPQTDCSDSNRMAHASAPARKVAPQQPMNPAQLKAKRAADLRAAVKSVEVRPVGGLAQHSGGEVAPVGINKASDNSCNSSAPIAGSSDVKPVIPIVQLMFKADLEARKAAVFAAAAAAAAAVESQKMEQLQQQQQQLHSVPPTTTGTASSGAPLAQRSAAAVESSGRASSEGGQPSALPQQQLRKALGVTEEDVLPTATNTRASKVPRMVMRITTEPPSGHAAGATAHVTISLVINRGSKELRSVYRLWKGAVPVEGLQSHRKMVRAIWRRRNATKARKAAAQPHTKHSAGNDAKTTRRPNNANTATLVVTPAAETAAAARGRVYHSGGGAVDAFPGCFLGPRLHARLRL